MKILLSTIPSDSHMWNLVFMQLYLEEMGHDVTNLGICVPLDTLISESDKLKPDIIVISSINGHANIEGVLLAQTVKYSNTLKKIPLILGGKIGTKGCDNAQYVDDLIKAGFDSIFIEENSIDLFTKFIKTIEQKRNILNTNVAA